jgi:hypothetical protein
MNKAFISLILAMIFVFIFTGTCAQPVMAASDIVINEAIIHPSTGNKEWVEFYSASGTDLTNYWIDDDTDFINDSGGSKKRQMTTIIKGSDVQHSVFELSSSMFNNDGDTISLFSPDGTLADQYHYEKDPGNDVSIGRNPDGIGNFVVLAQTTKGSANSAPQPSNTPTPAPTTKPTKEPKATKVSEKKVSDDVVNDEDVESDSVSVGKVIPSVSYSKAGSALKVSSRSARPTSILGVATKSAAKKPTPKVTNSVLVKGSSETKAPFIAMILGGLLIVGCGILIFLKKRGIISL